MKNLRIAAITILASSLLWSACSEDIKQSGDPQARIDSLENIKQRIEEELALLREAGGDNGLALRLLPVQVASVEIDTFRHFIDVVGTVRSDQNSLITSKSAGVITKIFITEGQSVAAGQVLAELDNSVLSRSLDQLESNYDYALTMYNKYKKVWESNVGSEAQYLQAKNNKESLEKQIEVLKQQIRDTKITAPFAGVIDAVMPKVGEALSPGMPFCRIVNLSNLRIETTVAESYISKVSQNAQTSVFLKDVQKEFQAPIRAISKSIDAGSRSFMVTVDVPASARGLVRPNMLATVTLNVETVPDAIVIPVNTVQRFEKEAFVYVAENSTDGAVARKRTVKTGAVYRGRVHVIEGLQAGEKLITIGFQELSDGDKLVVQ